MWSYLHPVTTHMLKPVTLTYKLCHSAHVLVHAQQLGANLVICSCSAACGSPSAAVHALNIDQCRLRVNRPLASQLNHVLSTPYGVKSCEWNITMLMLMQAWQQQLLQLRLSQPLSLSSMPPQHLGLLHNSTDRCQLEHCHGHAQMQHLLCLLRLQQGSHHPRLWPQKQCQHSMGTDSQVNSTLLHLCNWIVLFRWICHLP